MGTYGRWRGVSLKEFRSMFEEASKARNAIFHFECEDDPVRYSENRKKLARLLRMLEFAEG